MEKQKRRLAYILIVPVVAFVVLFIVYPVIELFRLSFTDKVLTDPNSGVFVGLQSYAAVFRDPVTLIALKNTFFYVFGGVGVTILLGLLVGQLLSKDRLITRITSGLLLIPWAMPPVIIAAAWKWMLHPQLGVINDLMLRTHLTSKAIGFLSSPHLALPTLIAVLVWRLFPLQSILVSGGIQGIPHERFEAAIVDGASRFQSFFYITIPSIRFILLTTTIMNTLWILNSIALVLIMTGGGPLHYSELLTTHIYKTGFRFYKFGEASAIAAFNFSFVLVISIGYLLVFKQVWQKVVKKK